MTCDKCCIYSGRTDWHKGDYDRPVCPFYKSGAEPSSYVEIMESDYKARGKEEK